MINLNPLDGSVRTAALQRAPGPAARTVHDDARELAADSASITARLPDATRDNIAHELSRLKVQLSHRLTMSQMTTMLLTAGALLGGPGGTSVQTLGQRLAETMTSSKRIDALTEKIEAFHDAAGPAATKAFRDLHFATVHELTNNATLPHGDVPVALFIAGGVAASHVDRA